MAVYLKDVGKYFSLKPNKKCKEFVYAFEVSSPDPNYRRIVRLRCGTLKNGASFIHIVSVNFLKESHSSVFDGYEELISKEEWRHQMLKCAMNAEDGISGMPNDIERYFGKACK